MKTQIIDRPVAIEAGESQEFTIKANGKAFRALISTLYENKIQSIVREIWSNALDAHIDAGFPERPFTVSFPDVYNATFAVRDYGKAMSHAEVMHLYSTVFESTKEESEDEAGKFGLGSKSPFAYTDTFSVVSIQDGMKRHYSAVIGKKGIPSIHFFGETETDEEQGVEVSFPIKNEDIRAFRRAAKRVSHGFDVKPAVQAQGEDSEEFEGWPELDVVLSGDGWKILRGNIEGYSSQAYAKMGPVLYPINVNAIEDLPIEARQLLQTTIVIDFPMGAVEMTPSREALSYGSDEPTIDSIRTRAIDIVTEMIVGYQARYDVCTSHWDACCQFVEDMSVTTPVPVRTALEKTANWKGKPLVKAFKVNTYKIGADNSACLITGDKRNNKILRFKTDAEFEITPRRQTIVFVEDVDHDKRAAARIKHHYESMDPRPLNVVWIKSSTVRLCAKKAPALDLLELFDGVEMLLVDDLDMPPKATYTRGGSGLKRPVSVRQLDYDGRMDIRIDLSPEDFAAGGYYVPMERNEVHRPMQMQAPSRVLSALKQVGAVPNDTHLYGAPKTLWKLFEGDQWVNIYDHAATTFTKMKPKASMAKRAMIDAVVGDSLLCYLKENTNSKDVGFGVLSDALDYLKSVSGLTRPDVAAYKQLAFAVGKSDHLEGWAEFDDTELEYHKLCVNESYPLIDLFRRQCSYEDNMVDKLAHYVQVCDKAALADSENTVAIAA